MILQSSARVLLCKTLRRYSRERALRFSLISIDFQQPKVFDLHRISADTFTIQTQQHPVEYFALMHFFSRTLQDLEEFWRIHFVCFADAPRERTYQYTRAIFLFDSERCFVQHALHRRDLQFVFIWRERVIDRPKAA